MNFLHVFWTRPYDHITVDERKGEGSRGQKEAGWVANNRAGGQAGKAGFSQPKLSDSPKLARHESGALCW